MEEFEYAGFWIRTGAAIIDSVLLLILLVPIVHAAYGPEYWLSSAFIQGPIDFLANFVLPAIAVVVFWIYRSATPGKLATRLTIVDARTGAKPTTKQFVIRYLGYYVSMLPFFLGLIWVGIDKRKQGWHDKLAGTVVTRATSPAPVRFDKPE